MSTAPAAVVEFFSPQLPFLSVLIQEHDLVAQPIAAAAVAAPFPAAVTPRAYRL